MPCILFWQPTLIWVAYAKNKCDSLEAKWLGAKVRLSPLEPTTIKTTENLLSKVRYAPRRYRFLYFEEIRNASVPVGVHRAFINGVTDGKSL